MEDVKTSDQLNILFQESYKRPVLIFMHSDNDKASMRIKGMLGRAEPMEIITEPVNIINVDIYPDISKEIEKMFNVVAQIPQIIVVRNGQAVYYENQDKIFPEKIEDHILLNQ